MRGLCFSYEGGRLGSAYRDNEGLYVTTGVKTRIVAAIGELAMSRPGYGWWPEGHPRPFTWPREVEDGQFFM